MTVYLIRHGESTYNVKRLFAGTLDAPLTETGREQARALRPFFEGKRLDGIYSSDLSRAVETCRLMIGDERPIEEEPALREMSFGIFEGAGYDALAEEHPDLLEQWAEEPVGFQIPGGESLSTFYERVTGAYDEILSRHEEEDEILITAHGGTIQAILSRELTGSVEGYWRYAVENATINQLQYVQGTPVLMHLNRRGGDK